MYWTAGAPAPAWAKITSPDFHGVFANATLRSAYAYAWGQIAAHFAGKTNVMFELINEPGVGSTLGSADVPNYSAFLNASITQIRSHETVTHMIIVPWMVDPANDEIVTAQTYVGDSNVYWAKHTYTPYATNYNPDGRAWSTVVGGWVPYPTYLALREQQCANKAAAWGQHCVNTEFGRSAAQVPLANVTAWLNVMLKQFNQCNYTMWTIHSWEQGDAFDIKTNQAYYMPVLSPYMPRN